MGGGLGANIANHEDFNRGTHSEMSANATATFYLTLNDATRAVIGQSTTDPAKFGHAQQTVDDLNHWRKVLGTRPESIVLQHGLNEATVGLFLLRLDYIDLPSSHSGYSWSYRCIVSTARRIGSNWPSGWGGRDVKWASLMDPDSGVLSVRYSDGFFPELRDSVAMYRGIAAKIYRELSEFVHGNHQTWGITKDRLEFSENAQEQWFANFSDANRAVTYASCLRFLMESNIQDVAEISALVQNCSGHVEPIRVNLANTKG